MTRKEINRQLLIETLITVITPGLLCQALTDACVLTLSAMSTSPVTAAIIISCVKIFFYASCTTARFHKIGTAVYNVK
jgi:choline-glycine betaine transporter